MFRSLVNELVQRRLWPIPVAALVVAIVVPLLFMGSSDGGPASTAPAAAPKSDVLPAEADALLSTDERVVPSRRSGNDPFDRPSSVQEEAATKGATAGLAIASAKAKSAVQKLVDQAQGTNGGSTGSAPQGTTAAPDGETTTKSPSKRPTTPKLGPVSPSNIRLASVDVRYGSTKNAPVQRTIPQRKVFQADGEAIAVFIRYSGKRNRALFAIAPGVRITGSVDCLRSDGVCRYLAIPDGGWARLSYRRADGTRVSRRLDVAIDQIVAKGKPTLSEAKLEQGNCVLDKLLNLPAGSFALPLERCG